MQTTTATPSDPYAQAVAKPPKTIQEIDDLIYGIYPSGGDGSGRLNSKADSSALVQNLFPSSRNPNPYDKDGFESVDTSINEYDCLIHSFLLGVSPNFRRLTSDERDTFADNFRRRILIAIPEFTKLKTALLSRPGTNATRAFLSDEIAEKLSNVYGVNIVFCDKQGLNKKVYGADPATRQYMLTVSIKPGKSYIFIYNPDNIHYRIIRRKSDKKYLFSDAEGQTIVQQMAGGPTPAPATARPQAVVTTTTPGGGRRRTRRTRRNRKRTYRRRR